MKKLLLSTLVTVILHCSLHAQLTKASWMIGGSLGFSSSTTPAPYGNYNYTLVSIAPKAGYFLIDRLAAGLTVNTSFSHSHYDNTVINPSTFHDEIYGVGPFVRYYFLPAQKMANILLEVSDQYNWISVSQEANSHQNSYGFAAGPAIFLNPSVALECTLGYTWNKGGGSASAPLESHVFKTAIGLQVYLAGKKHKG
jgi:hypothetical protein